MLKAHTETGSHLKIQRTIQKIVEMVYKWDKMANDVRQMFYKWEFWIGHTKKPLKKINCLHIESNYPKELDQVETTMLYDHIPVDNRNLLTMVDHFISLVGLCQCLTKNLKLLLMQLNFYLLFIKSQIHFKVIMVQSFSIQL